MMTKRTMSGFLLAGLAGLAVLLLAACGDNITNNGIADPPSSQIQCAGPDSDGDGLPDCQETQGWQVIVDLDGYGEPLAYIATSNPGAADTDGDGLNDYEEYLYRTDARFSDTDGDGLNDLAEVRTYFSNPSSVDTDGDARPRDIDGDPTGPPNPALFDGNELLVLHTSPTLADTDGDDKTDFEEAVGGGSNPLVADLPILDVRFVGNVDVALAGTISGSCTESNTKMSATLQAQESGYSNSDNSSTASSASLSETVGSETSATVTVGFPWSASASGSHSESSETTTASSTTNEHSTSFTSDSSKKAQQEFQDSVEKSCFSGSETTGGIVTMGVQLGNGSKIGYTLENLKLTVLHRSGSSGAAFATLGSTTDAEPVVKIVSLAPFSTTGTITLALEVPAQKAMDLLANPSGLFFEAGTYDITDEAGRNYAFINETALGRTGLVIVDYGDRRQAERFLVATNVERNPDGSPAGLTMAQVLTAISKPFTTVPGWSILDPMVSTGNVLASLDGFAFDPDMIQFWFVTGSSPDLQDPDINFEDVVLHQGDVIKLVLLRDSDGDGLWDREEYLHGTDPNVADSDGDGLTDFEEIKVGWNNGYNNTQVFSSALTVHSDGDSLPDDEEKLRGTDPLNNDTDHDGRSDYYEVRQVGRSPIVPEIISVGARGQNLAKDRGQQTWAWGGNGAGQLGLGSGVDQPIPVKTGGSLHDVYATNKMGARSFFLGIGAGHSMLLLIDGRLYSAGMGTDGQLGVGIPAIVLPACTIPLSLATNRCSTGWRPVVHPHQNLSPPIRTEWRGVAAGETDTLAVDSAGHLWWWGTDAFGAIRNSPLVFPGSRIYTAVSAGSGIYLALDSAGRLYNWGDGFSAATVTIPTRVGTDTDWAAISAGERYALALKADGSLWAWGWNGYGGTGLGTSSDDYSAPYEIGCCYKTISAGSTGASAIKDDGTLWSWGHNPYGALGLGSQDPWQVCTGLFGSCPPPFPEQPVVPPTQVGTSANWVAVSVGLYSSIGVQADGSYWTWGTNNFTGLLMTGMLGLGDDSDRLSPARMPPFGP